MQVRPTFGSVMFAQSADQELFEATTVQFLANHYPPSRIRELRAEPTTCDAATWKRGAELGWTSLLVAEASGGGSISEDGLLDLLIVAFHFGRHAAPGPLFGTNVVALALDRWGAPDHEAALAELLSGSAAAAWAGPGSSLRAEPAEAGIVLDGAVGAVDGAGEAEYLLVRAGEPESHYLVPLRSPGIELIALEGVDLTRRFARVTFHGVALPASARVGATGDGVSHDRQLLDVMAVLQAGEIAGAMDRSFELTLAWTFDRYSFGRPLASYQEIKHRVADLRTHLEASSAVAWRAARAVGRREADAASWAAAAKAYTGTHGPEVIQDCIQLHGGIGVTFEHDLHLLLRRAVTDAQLFGTPDFFRRQVALQVSS